MVPYYTKNTCISTKANVSIILALNKATILMTPRMEPELKNEILKLASD